MTGLEPLASFSYDWVGGDIHGLRDLAEKLLAYVPKLQDAVGPLSITARTLTGDWKGSAASAFTSSWTKQTRMAAALEDYVTAVAGIINSLAVQLSEIESTLETEAEAMKKAGVEVGDDGSTASYKGAQGEEQARLYGIFYREAQHDATTARDQATQALYSAESSVLNTNPHPSVGDTVTMSGLLADLLATPTAARREVLDKIKGLKGKNLNLKDKIANAIEDDEDTAAKLQSQSKEAGESLEELEKELGNSGRTENGLSKLLDTRISDVQALLQGNAGGGRHAGGNTDSDLKAASAADEDSGTLDKLLKFGDDIPVVDVVTTLAGTAVGTYADVKGGQPLGSALRDEAVSNTLGTVAANGAGYMVGATIGGELGAAGGPVGIAVGAVVGYGVGDLTHNLLIENWSGDRQQYGAVLGTVYGVGHSELATVDDGRETAVGIGHAAESVWDRL